MDEDDTIELYSSLLNEAKSLIQKFCYLLEQVSKRGDIEWDLLKRSVLDRANDFIEELPE